MTSHVAARPLAHVPAVDGAAVTGSAARLVVAAAVSALLAAAASRPWGLGVLALVAFVPAFDAIARAQTARTGAVLGAVAALGVGTVAYEATVAISVHVYVLALLLAPLPFAAAGAIAVRFGRAVGRRRSATRSPATPLAALTVLPALWCCAEWLPAQPGLFGVYAMPLGAIGYSQAELPTLHLASLSSVTAVSAVVLAVNALLVVLWRTHLPLLRLGALTGLAGLGLLVALMALAGSSTPDAGSAQLRLVQPNLPDSAYLAANRLAPARLALVESLVELGAQPGGAPDAPELTILPEAAWPGPLDTSSAEAGRIDPLLDDARLPGPLLFGAPSRGRSPADPPEADEAPEPATTWFANSAFLLSDGVLTRVQDKLHLVPIAETGLRAGSGPAVFPVGRIRVAVLICYDVVFPATSRAAAQAGATLLAVLTDDSFAARGDAPKLHVRLAVFRAVETGRPVALASNTGPSLLVDASGRTVARTPALVATSLTAALPLGRRDTPYSAYGDWMGVLTALISLAICAIGASR
ncbi:MAG TPA: apolipoprotein N-acyltransferase, partial [Trueperaceae bacterium]|nr:apolipoprotein N-acyltransferase [Trueperaceae bacterium]